MENILVKAKVLRQFDGWVDIKVEGMLMEIYGIPTSQILPYDPEQSNVKVVYTSKDS